MKKRMFGILANGKKFLLNVKEEDGKILAGTDFQEHKEYIHAVEIVEPEEVKEIITFRTQFENYISSQKGILSDATLKIYKNIKNKHVQGLMDMDVGHITINDISKALEEELEKGISESTVNKYRQVIKKVLAFSQIV